jgi:hypothetical protein
MLVTAGSIIYDPAPNIISNGERTAYPWVAIDGNNVTHVIYVTINGSIIYTNNAAGSFHIGGKLIDNGKGSTAVPPVAIATGPNNVVGIVYDWFGKDDQIYYRQSNDGGQTWTGRRQISRGSKTAAPHLAFDSGGNAHIVWIEAACGTSLYNVYYRVHYANDALSPVLHPKDECSPFHSQNRPQITIANGKPHIVFERNNSANGEIYYVRLEGSQWVSQNVSNIGGTESLNATMSSDGGNNLFVAWEEKTNNHDVLFRASFDGGLNWSSINPISQTPEEASFPNLTWSPGSKRAYLVWADKTGSSDGLPEIWEREFDPVSTDTTAPDRVSHFNGNSVWPTIGVGTSRADIVWHDNVQTTYQIWDWGGHIQSNCITNPGAGLLLEGGQDTTRDTSLSGTITPPTGCVPDQMQVSLDTPVTDATAKVPYSASIPVQNVQPGACVTHTVYVRLFNDGVGGTPFSDSIAIDTTVEASSSATNPHLIGEPIDYTGVPGASDGDPKYTRDDKFFLAINDAGDCTGLASFDVRKSISGTISGGSYRNDVPLPAPPTPGSLVITVDISDTLGNKTTLDPMQLIYDPDRPTLVASQNPTVTAPLSTTNIIVPLSFDNIKVNDPLYGQGESLPVGRQFWGAWIANSTTNVTPDNPGLKWFPVQVEVPTTTFTLNWDLFTGLPVSQEHAGDFYVYVRFLDGAGNPTAKAIEANKITLTAPFTRPTLYLPQVYK